VKHSQFQDKEDLATRIAEACNAVLREHLKAIVQHSVNAFEKCLRAILISKLLCNH
ncbi:hypothetical protein BDF20DRAFT_816517, partial [Mycotypha africana]|uniref:uncharacterized protein n=1 Tax=Mycotypha africana TaxID=64632 RepID=UPI00230164C1